MSFSKGGTFTLGNKTYNINQINSVYLKTVPKHEGIGQLYVFGGFVGAIIGILSQNSILWFILTVVATVAAAHFSTKIDWAVYFDMSSGSVAAFRSPDKNEVERIRDDIIQGLEEGYFPNYLQGRQ